jgi:hypothetical protein
LLILQVSLAEHPSSLSVPKNALKHVNSIVVRPEVYVLRVLEIALVHDKPDQQERDYDNFHCGTLELVVCHMQTSIHHCEEDVSEAHWRTDTTDLDQAVKQEWLVELSGRCGRCVEDRKREQLTVAQTERVE